MKDLKRTMKKSGMRAMAARKAEMRPRRRALTKGLPPHRPRCALMVHRLMPERRSRLMRPAGRLQPARPVRADGEEV